MEGYCYMLLGENFNLYPARYLTEWKEPSVTFTFIVPARVRVNDGRGLSEGSAGIIGNTNGIN